MFADRDGFGTIRASGTPGRALVARAIVPPNVAADLRDQLNDAWRDYTQWYMPGVDP